MSTTVEEAKEQAWATTARGSHFEEGICKKASEAFVYDFIS